MERELRKLLMKRSEGEKVLIKWNDIEILLTILEVSGNKVRLMLEAPGDVSFIDIPL